MRDLRGTWPRALGSLAGAIFLILAIRWALLEPYVIPSGSMIPTLLVHDHILVNKFSYGLRAPFTTSWLVSWSQPARGDVVVFRSVEDDSVFVVKRVAGLPGDEVAFDSTGRLMINSKPVEELPLSEEEAMLALSAWPEEAREEFLADQSLYREKLGRSSYLVARRREGSKTSMLSQPFQVPEGGLFMLGDNRDNSSDSRVWGSLSLERILGRASVVWLSCEETLPDSTQVCDPQKMRWDRILKRVQ